jgi:hypothetical protein
MCVFMRVCDMLFVCLCVCVHVCLCVSICMWGLMSRPATSLPAGLAVVYAALQANFITTLSNGGWCVRVAVCFAKCGVYTGFCAYV